MGLLEKEKLYISLSAAEALDMLHTVYLGVISHDLFMFFFKLQVMVNVIVEWYLKLICCLRFEGELSVDAVTDWFATAILKLPRIFYHTKESMVISTDSLCTLYIFMPQEKFTLDILFIA